MSESSDVRGQRWALGTLAVATVLSMTTWFSASAVIPQLRDLWDLSDTTAAWLTIAVQLGFVTGPQSSTSPTCSRRAPSSSSDPLGLQRQTD